ncbi:YaaR family protein [Niameybacter massiliensis]|uniref:YaaR family protein n=1 Tax=Holtiella tumoricola TaxID=3018743 RepID=A0AA42DQ54_9FIRM|nr:MULTISPECIES: YaaR family protein [Lachnospirales]MDA3732793.1 YaaR family protein [Holtiella tumoricola]
MADLQINQIQLPQLRELATGPNNKIDKGFKFTLLSHIEEGELQDSLKVMIERITEQGNKLSEHMDIRDMRLYRSMISEFMNEVVSNSHKFSRENFLDRRGRHRVYGIVRLVNDKVDALATELLKVEKDKIDILDRIGEIQGLLLDLAT